MQITNFQLVNLERDLTALWKYLNYKNLLKVNYTLQELKPVMTAYNEVSLKILLEKGKMNDESKQRELTDEGIEEMTKFVSEKVDVDFRPILLNMANADSIPWELIMHIRSIIGEENFRIEETTQPAPTVDTPIYQWDVVNKKVGK